MQLQWWVYKKTLKSQSFCGTRRFVGKKKLVDNVKTGQNLPQENSFVWNRESGVGVKVYPYFPPTPTPFQFKPITACSILLANSVLYIYRLCWYTPDIIQQTFTLDTRSFIVPVRRAWEPPVSPVLPVDYPDTLPSCLQWRGGREAAPPSTFPSSHASTTAPKACTALPHSLNIQHKRQHARHYSPPWLAAGHDGEGKKHRKKSSKVVRSEPPPGTPLAHGGDFGFTNNAKITPWQFIKGFVRDVT